MARKANSSLEKSCVRADTRLWRRYEDQGGFSMVELMVVIAIIGIIMSLAIPQFSGARTIGADQKIQQTLDRVLQSAEESYLSYGNFCGAVGLSVSGCNAFNINNTTLSNFNHSVIYVSQFTTANSTPGSIPEISIGPANWSWGGSFPQYQMFDAVQYDPATSTCWFIYHIQATTQAGAGFIGKTQPGTWYAKTPGTANCYADETYYLGAWGTSWQDAPMY